MATKGKQCSRCKRISLLYDRDLRAKDGLQSQCVPCQRASRRTSYRRGDGAIRRSRQKIYWAKLSKEERVKRQRRYTLSVHGVTPQQFDKLLKKQKGLCALCKQEPTGKRTKVLQVDHDHKTGKIRGLLCNECNTALGRLGDDVKGLNRALKYLKKSE